MKINKSFFSLSKFDAFFHSCSLSFIVVLKNRIKTSLNFLKYQNQHHPTRHLEIGPGLQRLPGFETLSIIDGPVTDYVVDLTRTQFFSDQTFDLIYASHVLEHFAWYQVETVLQNLFRLLKPGGVLEIVVPDGLKIAQTLVAYENEKTDQTALDGWYRFNPDHDPCVWAAGRLYTYGEGDGQVNSPNWHRALFTPRYLKKILKKAGFVHIKKMTKKDIKGYDHGWISLGIKGVKP